MHVIVVIIIHNEKLMHHILLNIIIFSISTFEFTFKFFQRSWTSFLEREIYLERSQELINDNKLSFTIGHWQVENIWYMYLKKMIHRIYPSAKEILNNKIQC